MSATPIAYKKVPGHGSSAVGYSRLYVGPDHLLLVDSAGWNESYRRFYFRDIQAFTIRKSQWGKVQNVAWALVSFLTAAIAIQADDVGAVVAWSITGMFLAGLIINILRGPTCTSHIQTAVQTTKIGPLKRVKRAQKFLTQLKPLIAAVQGTGEPASVVANNPPVATAPVEPGP